MEVEIIMDGIFESQAFCNGVAVGINLYQQKVIMAHENNLYGSGYGLMYRERGACDVLKKHKIK